MSGLDQRIKEYFEAQRLPEAAVQAIRQQGHAEAQVSRQSRSMKLLLPVAASVALVIFAVFWGQVQIQESIDRQRNQLATEVAKSHTKNFEGPFLYSATDFGALQTGMKRLDFSLLPAEAVLRDRFELSGARYCSVGGRVACHFQATCRDSGRQGSLYVAVLDASLKRVSPGQCQAGGVTCQMWNDGARFFCFAATDAGLASELGGLEQS